MASVTPVSESPRRNTNLVKGLVSEKSAQHKEDVAKWATDQPGRPPGESLYTWKSFSRQRYPSEQYTKNYAQIDWSA